MRTPNEWAATRAKVDRSAPRKLHNTNQLGSVSLSPTRRNPGHTPRPKPQTKAMLVAYGEYRNCTAAELARRRREGKCQAHGCRVWVFAWMYCFKQPCPCYSNSDAVVIEQQLLRPSHIHMMHPDMHHWGCVGSLGLRACMHALHCNGCRRQARRCVSRLL